MKTFLISIIILIGLNLQSFSQIVDTTYYDRNWQGVKFKELAEYIRYDFNFNDPAYANRTRVFFISGQLEKEGIPLSNNKLNGLDAKWKGLLTTYNKNGNKIKECNYDDIGVLNGTTTTWNESGIILSEENYENGVLQGPSVVYPLDNPDIYYITIFKKGKPENDETIIHNKNGNVIKVNYYTKKIITTEPTLKDMKISYKDGLETVFYDINGIYIGINYARAKEYGKYYKCFIHLINNSNEAIEIDPEKISGLYIKGNDSRLIELMPADEYLAKIARNQALSQALEGFSSGMNTYNAGYSTSTTTGFASGSGGWASGTAVTTTYNAQERQAILNQEQQKLQQHADADKQYKDRVDGSILKHTIVDSGMELYKVFYIKYLSADKLILNIEVGDQKYSFECEKLNLFWNN